MKTNFNASQFIPTQFSTSEDKAKFANQFVDFVESDFKKTKFPKWFYQELSNCFGLIACHNQEGFYNTFFTSYNGILNFLELIHIYPCYGQPEYTFCDVEKAVQEWIFNNSILNKWTAIYSRDIQDKEYAEYKRLKLKFEGDGK
jgi:hypothetical protein